MRADYLQVNRQGYLMASAEVYRGLAGLEGREWRGDEDMEKVSERRRERERWMIAGGGATPTASDRACWRV